MKRVKNHKKICVVPNCTRRSTIGNELSFHAFPRRGLSFVEVTTKLGIRETVDRHLEWLKRLRISQHRPDMFVCSQHFAPTDYYLPHIPVKTRVLKGTAVPSRNLPESMGERRISANSEERNLQRANRRRGRQKRIHVNKMKTCDIFNDDDPSGIAGTSAFFVVPILGDADRLAGDEESRLGDSGDALLPLHDDCPLRRSEKTELEELAERPIVTTKRNIATQLRHSDIFLAALLHNDDALYAICGIQSHPVLNEIVSLMMEYYPQNESSRLAPKDKIILTAMKLRTDATFAALASLFGCPYPSVCRKIFIDTLGKLSSIVRTVVQRLPSDVINENHGKSFSIFDNIVLVLDRIVISLEKPNCSRCLAKTKLPGKCTFTAKFMTGVTIEGTVIYVSDIYGGKATDGAMFGRSDLIDRMNRGEAIVTDDKFEIEGICKERGIRLLKPLKDNKEQWTKEEIFFNRKIGTARIHADRMNRRIRRFVILRHKISRLLIPHLQDIVIVCCALANLGTPILSSRELSCDSR